MMRRAVPLQRLDGIPVAAGLSTAQVERRRAVYGPNDVIETRRHPWWQLMQETARDPMLWFLAVTSGLYGLLGEHGEAAVLLAAIVPLVGMDAFLHRRTAASTEGLSARLASHATVERDGTATEVPAADLVPGDLVMLAAGDWLPADGLIISGGGMQVDESSLTGEAYPVEKRPLAQTPRHAAGATEVLVASQHWGFAGTRLLTGEGRLRVVWTGAQTIYGEIVRSAEQGTKQRTPLQDAIANLVRGLVIGAVAVCVVLAAVRLRQGYGWFDALLSALTLAIAALPEEFPVALGVFLGVGVYRLAQRQALVRRAVTVENIGRVSCICSDKTGTISEGRLALTHLSPAKGMTEQELLGGARRASHGDSDDPLAGAINRAFPLEGVADEMPVAIFPFTENRKRETVVLHHRDGMAAFTKGAAELILQLTDLSPSERQSWTDQILQFAAEGHKVIGCAWRPLGGDWAGGEPDRGYRWTGLLAFEDPVREGVPEAVAQCRAAGIRIVMVTGDHPATAVAIGREIGLGPQPRVLTGDDLDALLERGDPHALSNIDVIARAVPAQKVGLVRALQARGEIVAVTGDGVNDVPALQAADVGIAMGQRGTRSAREAAAIVLLDDDFRSIVRAIGEGQQLFQNLRRCFQYLLMIHVPLVTTAALIPLAGFPLLYLPLHIVWLELVIHPSALLVFQERRADQTLRQQGGPRRVRFFSLLEWAGIGLTGMVITAIVLALYLHSLDGLRLVEHARANALAALSLSSAGLVVGLSLLRTRMAQVISGSTVALTVVLVQTPGVSRLLHMQPLHRDDWLQALCGFIVSAGLAVIVGHRCASWHRMLR